MNGRAVLDTNIVIYHLQGHKPWIDFIGRLQPENIFVSVITRMELLSWDGLTRHDEEQIHAFLTLVNVAPLSAAIEREAISLRRETRLKLPDAIVAATAVIFEAAFITNDKTIAALNRRGLKVVIPA